MRHVYSSLVIIILLISSCKESTPVPVEKEVKTINPVTEDKSDFKGSLMEIQSAFSDALNIVTNEIAIVEAELQKNGDNATADLQRKKMQLQRIETKVKSKMATLKADSEKDYDNFLKTANSWLYDLDERMNQTLN